MKARTTTASSVPVAAIAAVVAVKSLANLVVAGRYGWHIDELYYRTASNHLAAGYVDFPPMTPFVGRVALELFGDSLVGLRLFAIGAGAGVVVLTAAIARELGGGRRAQVLAAIAAATSPALFGANTMFQTVSFDQLAWVAVAYTAVRVLRRGDRSSWVALGACAGAAMLTKYTAAVWLAAIGLGLIATAGGRARLRDRSALLAAAIAAALVLPNLWWQVRNGWPSVDFFRGQNSSVREETSRLEFLGELFMVVGPVALFVAATGCRRLARDRRFTPLAVATLFVPVAFFILGGKSYYAWPVLFPLIAVGACVVERHGRRVAAGLVGWAVLSAPMALPLLPESTMVDVGLADLRQDWADEIGWEELAATVEAAFGSLPPAVQAEAGLLTRNYGQAGAVDLFTTGLPVAASVSPMYAFWIPDRPDATAVVTVGFRADQLAEQCREFVELDRIDNAAGVDNEQRGAVVGLCVANADLEVMWRDLSGGVPPGARIAE